MKKVLWLLVCLLVVQNFAFSQTVYDDNFQENPNYVQGLKYLDSSQYSSAINEFKKAIRVNPNDVSSLIGLSNAYNLRAQYYNNTLKATDKAISDLKSALFFVKYFNGNTNEYTSAQANAQMEKNLSILEGSLNKTITPELRYKSAQNSRTKGEFAAAAYDYYQLLNNSTYKSQANAGLGDIYKIFNRPENAINFYKQALSVTPDNTELHLKLARTYEQVNDFSSSIKEYGNALDNSSESEDILNSLERIWQKKVDENPKDAEAHANLGVVYQKEKRYSEALEEYNKAVSLNPANINTRINIGTLYQEQKNYAGALDIYNSILQMQPQNTSVMLSKAQCLKELKRNEEAINEYKAILNLDMKNTTAKAELFDLLKDTMPTEQVLDFLYKNVQNSPTNADSYYEFAYELHNAGKIDDAIVYYNQTIKLDNTKIDAYINLSQAYMQKDDYSKAYETIQQAMKLAPNNELVKKQYNTVLNDYSTNTYNLASNDFQSGNYQKAIEEYMKISPATSDSLIGIAASYQSLNNNEKAIEYYKKAMELDSSNSELPYYIASIYANTNDFEKAKTYIDISLAKNSSNTQAKELSDYIKIKQTEGILADAVQKYDEEKYKDAITLFDKVLKITPDNATVYYYRALTYDALNNYQKAISDYKSTLKYAPDMIIAYYSLGVDYDAVQNYQLAKENYKKYVEKTTENNDYKTY
jgi:superkiller protein 3